MKRDPGCTLCKLHKTAQYVCLLGNGPSPCKVMIIGEAPGQREDDSGRPFVGKSGKLLEKLLEEAGLHRDDIFITNAVSCRPPDNRTPSKAEIKACNAWLEYQIKFVRPKFVLLLGATAYQSITGKTGITKARGRPFEKKGITYLPTFHPSAALHNIANEDPIRNDIKLFKDIIDNKGIPRENSLNIHSVRSERQFREMLEALTGVVSYDIETSCLYPWDPSAEITQIGFGTATGEYMIPCVHPESPWRQDEIKTMLKQITDKLEDCELVTHMGKFDYLWLAVRYGIWWHELADFDTGLAHYALDENSFHGLKELARQFCGAPDWDIDKDAKQGLQGLDKLTTYHAHDLYYTRQLYFIFKKKLDQDLEVNRVFKRILMGALTLFTEVEYDGNCVDHTKFDDAEKYLREEIAKAEAALKKYGNGKEGKEATNWGSTKQVAEILFEKLNIDPVEQTKGGAESTSESVLKRIDHPIAGLLLKRRAAKQQLSFFIDGWKPYIVKKFIEGQETWFIHPSFKLHGTVTGRLSSEHPNWQQIPRDPRIRQLVTAPPGWTLIEADLEQIELKVAAELSGDPSLVDAFNRGIDVHWLTMITELERGAGQAELVLDTARTYKQDKKLRYAEALEIVFEMGVDAAVEINPEWKELRKKAKAINFGYLFGMWWKKFKIYARDNYDIIVSDKEAQDSRKSFFAKYNKLDKWHEKQRTYARRNGYVRSLSGRKRRLPEAQTMQDTPGRREAERQAINSPVQSFANEINLMSAIQLRKEFPRSKVRIVATVHDAILAWVRNDCIETVVERLLKIMSRPALFDEFDIDFKVPISAEAKIGPWSKGVSFDKWKKAQVSTGTSRSVKERRV